MDIQLLCLCFLLFCSITFAELIVNLPGQPSNVSFKQYSGYIVTDAEHGRALFYYFVEADASDPLSLPLTVWFNGGPGCSSLGLGAFMENGPFRPGENGVLVKNEYSWNLESNMLYVESPIGVGFSYSNTTSDYKLWNDTTTAEDNLRFIVNWLEEFPEFENSDMFLAGENYAGHYIPQLAALILGYNKKPNIKPINLKAIALGNPLLDLDISILAGDYLWAHGVISDETLYLLKTVCNDSRRMHEYVQNIFSKDCMDVFTRVVEERSWDVFGNNILAPVCLSWYATNQFRFMEKHGNIHPAVVEGDMSNDVCITDRIFAYLNDPEVQKALHANTSRLPYRWDFCLAGPLGDQRESLETNIILLVSELIAEGIPILLFSGDQDAKVPVTQTRIIANNLSKQLKLEMIKKYGAWYDKKQVAGWSQSFGGVKDGKNVSFLTFATIRGGAQEVSFSSPSQALTLFRSFVRGSPLPPSNRD